MTRMFSLAGLAILLFASSLSAADVSGKWSGEVPARDGQVTTTFLFKVDGDKLTGTMTRPQGEVPLQDGKVMGDKISFTAPGGNAKMIFEGSISGDQLKMTRTREGGQAREFTLKRAQ
jgi:hypothetical protein